MGFVLLCWVGLTPRYLEPQFEVGSLPVSEGAGMLLLGGGVGMVVGSVIERYPSVVLVWRSGRRYCRSFLSLSVTCRSSGSMLVREERKRVANQAKAGPSSVCQG